jgi:rRNA maturation endonuclease Nob1
MNLHRRRLEELTRRQGLPVRDMVVDLDAETTQCPACLTTFRPEGVDRCPDCGLRLS